MIETLFILVVGISNNFIWGENDNKTYWCKNNGVTGDELLGSQYGVDPSLCFDCSQNPDLCQEYADYKISRLQTAADFSGNTVLVTPNDICTITTPVNVGDKVFVRYLRTGCTATPLVDQVFTIDAINKRDIWVKNTQGITYFAKNDHLLDLTVGNSVHVRFLLDQSTEYDVTVVASDVDKAPQYHRVGMGWTDGNVALSLVDIVRDHQSAIPNLIETWTAEISENYDTFGYLKFAVKFLSQYQK